MKVIFDILDMMGGILTYIVLTVIFWDQLNMSYNEDSLLLLSLINFLIAVIVANWICSKLDNKHDSANK